MLPTAGMKDCTSPVYGDVCVTIRHTNSTWHEGTGTLNGMEQRCSLANLLKALTGTSSLMAKVGTLQGSIFSTQGCSISGVTGRCSCPGVKVAIALEWRAP